MPSDTRVSHNLMGNSRLQSLTLRNDKVRQGGETTCTIAVQPRTCVFSVPVTSALRSQARSPPQHPYSAWRYRHDWLRRTTSEFARFRHPRCLQ